MGHSVLRRLSTVTTTTRLLLGMLGAVGSNLLVSFVFVHDDTAKSFAFVHQVERLVYLVDGEGERHEFVDLQGAVQVLLDILRELSAAAGSTEGGTTPCLADNHLERASGDFLTWRANADNAGLSPSFVHALERLAHGVHVTNALEGVVDTGTGVVADKGGDGANGVLAFLELLGVDEVSHSELLGEGHLSRVDVNADDLGASSLLEAHDGGETDTSEAEDGGGGSALNLHGVVNGAVASGDTATEEADLLEGGALGDLSHGDGCADSVLGESTATHEVEDGDGLSVFFDAEAAGAVGHHTLSLRGADFAAQVRLLRQAVHAVAALRDVQGDDVVSNLNVGDTFADRLHNTTTFVAKNDGETGRVVARFAPVGMADTTGQDLDADLSSARGSDLDGLHDEIGAVLPHEGGAAGDGLCHDDVEARQARTKDKRK